MSSGIVDRYLRLLEKFSSNPDDFRAILHPEFRQTEYPNALNPRGQESDLQDTLRRMALGGKILAHQTFKTVSSTESGGRLVVEASWEGKMAIEAGPLKSGQLVRAHFCMVFELVDGKIHRQRNYDCFLPFA